MKIKKKIKKKSDNSSWIKNRHFLFIFSKFSLLILIIIGSILSIFFSLNYLKETKNNAGEFGETYNLKYEVQLNVNNENANLYGSENNSFESAENRLKKTATSFEEWLYLRDIYNDGVQYSIIENIDKTYSGWIFTNLYNIEKIDFQFEEVRQDPMRVLNNNTTNNFIEIIPYDKNSYNPISNKVLINSFGLNVTNLTKSNVDQDVENNSSLNIPGVEFSFPVNVNIKKFMEFKAGLNTNPNELSTNYKWYVFNDLEKLIQRLNYIKSVCYWNQNDNNLAYLDWGKKGLLPLTLYDSSLNNNLGPDSPPGVENLNHIEFLYESLSEEEKTWGNISSKDNADATVSITKNNILDFFNQYDSKTLKEKTTGNFDSSIQPIIQKNIIGEINSDNYHEWFPESYELSPIVEEGVLKNNPNLKLPSGGTLAGPEVVSKLKIPVKEESTLPDFLFPNPLNKNVNEIYDFFKNYSSFAPIKTFTNPSIVPNATEPIVFFGSGSATMPLIQNSITGMSAYTSIFLASGIILLTIGMIVSIIYRVPGLVAFLAIVFTNVVTMAFSGLLGLTFSFGSFLAIILGTLLTLLSSIVFLERIRKNMIDNKSVFDSSMISIRKSVMTIIDIHLVSIIVGLCAAMLGASEMIDLGFELILTSLVSLLSVFIIFIFIQYNFSKSKLFWNSNLYFFNIDKKIANKPEREKKLMSKIDAPFKLSKWIFISAFLVFISIIIIVISLVFTIGIHNSIDFKESTSIYIYEKNIDVNKVISLLGGSWNIKINDHFLLIQSSQIMSQADVVNKLSSLSINSNNIFVSKVVINALLQTTSTNTLSLLAAAGFIGIYVTIRLGIFALIPIFISTLLTTLFSSTIQYILFIPIDSYFIYAMTFVFALNSILAVIFISITKSRFTSRKIFNEVEIKNFLQRNIINLGHLWFSLLLTITISIGISMIFISTSLIWSFLSILIASMISIPLILLFTSYMYYVILIFRQKYIKNIIIDNISNTAYKFDSVDEQLIKGINYRG